MKQSLGAKPLVFPTPVWVVGSYDPQDKPNIMTIAWGGVCCSKPPCLTISLRKATYTYDCITARKAFTVNVSTESDIVLADYCGIASGKTADKFAITGLTPVRSELVDAPYIHEFALAAECKLVQTVELGLHTMFIGEILDIKADDSVLGSDGLPDLDKLRPVAFGPVIRTYHGLGDYLGPAFSIGQSVDKTGNGN
ncbi:flavin reductase family protein [Desulfonatronum thioautotrophicum]|uniref:flavin reductase family protein n=1 Tax=Desulfonatronum thioautotrophicum TaxID=617001 RepID=UPI0005EB3DE5|nr:flavin reductase family protein [Desulfonatronum thioautotrophicum]